MNKYLCMFLLLLTGIWAHSQRPENDVLLQQGGHIRFDFGQNGCGNSAIPAPVRMNCSELQQVNFADPISGTYAFLPGSYTVSPQLEYPDYFSVSPDEAHVEIGGSNSFVDFCLSPNGYYPDAEITIIPSNRAVAGESNSYRLVVRNIGNQTISGIAKMNLPSGAVTYLSSEPVPDARNSSTLQWSYANLRPFESRVYDVVLQINLPAHSDLEVGENLVLSANVTSFDSDPTPANNTVALRQPLVASPSGGNNKICIEGDVAPVSMIGQYLNYVINFENTGSTVIQKIVINDEIDTNQFEITSLQFTNMSHPGIPLVIGNKIEVYFQDINLQPGAQGNAAFKIKTKPTIPAGSTVSNKAKIYFDFNFPIETNAALTTFQVLGLPEISTPAATLVPNPARGHVEIEANTDMLSIIVFDVQGRKMAQVLPESNRFLLDVSNYTSGLYHLKIETANGTISRKLIKQ